MQYSTSNLCVELWMNKKIWIRNCVLKMMEWIEWWIIYRMDYTKLNTLNDSFPSRAVRHHKELKKRVMIHPEKFQQDNLIKNSWGMVKLNAWSGSLLSYPCKQSGLIDKDMTLNRMNEVMILIKAYHNWLLICLWIDNMQAPRFVTQPSASASIVSEGRAKFLQCQAVGNKFIILSLHQFYIFFTETSSTHAS